MATQSIQATSYLLFTIIIMPVTDYTEQSNRRFFKLNAKTGELLESRKEWENRVTEKKKSVLWKFTKLYIKETEREWKRKENLHLLLQDKDTWEAYDVKCTLDSSFGRSMLNSLAWEVKKNELKHISVSIRWQQKDGGKMRHYLNVYNNDNKAERLLSFEDQKKLQEIIYDNEWEYIKTDYKKLNKILREKIDEINTNDYKLINVDDDLPFGEEDKTMKLSGGAEDNPLPPFIPQESDKENDDLPF